MCDVLYFDVGEELYFKKSKCQLESKRKVVNKI